MDQRHKRDVHFCRLDKHRYISLNVINCINQNIPCMQLQKEIYQLKKQERNLIMKKQRFISVIHHSRVTFYIIFNCLQADDQIFDHLVHTTLYHNAAWFDFSTNIFPNICRCLLELYQIFLKTFAQISLKNEFFFYQIHLVLDGSYHIYCFCVVL